MLHKVCLPDWRKSEQCGIVTKEWYTLTQRKAGHCHMIGHHVIVGLARVRGDAPGFHPLEGGRP